MTQNVEYAAATPGWRGSGIAHGTTSARPSWNGKRPRSGLGDQRLEQAVRACGYDARRISEYFGISVRHLQRWFSAHVGCSPRVWFAEQRLQEARRRLTGSASVKEVAYGLGFKRASQFSRDFRRRFGHPPSAEMTRARLQPPPGPSRR